MLYYQAFDWLLLHGASRFSVHLGPDVQKPEEVEWWLELQYIAAGAQWRRMKSWERPHLWLSLSLIKLRGRMWKDLERADFWNIEPEYDKFGFPTSDDEGGLEVHFRPARQKAFEQTKLGEVAWRVAQRDGALFTVELTATELDREHLNELTREQTAITADGTEERVARDATFWEKNAELYLIEQVPFGTATIQVPRNSRDPEKHAMARARALLGVGEPEHVTVDDFNGREKACDLIKSDLFVTLHYHGYFED